MIQNFLFTTIGKKRSGNVFRATTVKKKKTMDYEKKQFEEEKAQTGELEKVNTLLLVNTLATVVTGIATLIVAIISLRQ